MASLQFFLLGNPRVVYDGVSVKFRSGKTLALIIYLLVTRKSHRRDSLANLLWPESDHTGGRALLRSCLYSISGALESKLIQADRQTVTINQGCDLDMDIDRLRSLMGECRDHGHSSDEVCASCLEPLTEAVDLYQGDFLSGLNIDSVNFENWQYGQEQRLRSDVETGFQLLVRCLTKHGTLEETVRYCGRWLELDRANEIAHRELMDLYAKSGRRADALRQYGECVRILAEELGVAPEVETVRLYDEIKEDRRHGKHIAEKNRLEESIREAVSTNLPRQLTSFVGRECETAEVKALLSSTCLLTLTGAGGCGKTRLALKVASEVLEDYKDGVWFVDLAPVSEPARITEAMASALDVRQWSERLILESLLDYLRSKRLLIVLDNCEHLVQRCAELVNTLLRKCRNLRILTTSREALNTEGEIIWRVPSLSFPELNTIRSLRASELLKYEAVRLFTDRAVSVLPAFTVAERNAQAVASICSRLDGIPLALELASASMKILSCDQILDRLDDRFELLTGGGRTALLRHQTLRATVDWSFGLLSEKEKALLRRLSVFSGGCTIEAAETVCAVEENDIKGLRISPGEILGLLTHLTDKSLMFAAEGRYRLLETIREYGLGRLEESGEAEVILKRHADYFLELAERAELELLGSEQLIWLDRLRQEIDNLRTAIGWSKRSNPEAGLRLGGALWWFWHRIGFASEGHEWLEGMLAERICVSPHVRAKALATAGLLVGVQGEWERGIKLVRKALNIFRNLGDKSGMSLSLFFLSAHTYFQGEFQLTREYCEEGLTLSRQVGDKWLIATLLRVMGIAENQLGDHDRSIALHEESLALYREIGDKMGIAYSLRNMGLVPLHKGDYERVEGLCEESLVLSQELGDRWSMAWALEELAAVTILGKGKPEQAARLYGAAESLRKEISVRMPDSERAIYKKAVAAIHAALDDDTFEEAWNNGRVMTLERVIEYAQGDD